VYGFGSKKETANVPADVSKVVFRNKTNPTQVKVNFRKYVCDSLGDVAANQGSTGGDTDVGKLSMSANGDLGALLNQTAAPAGGGDKVTPSNDGRGNCHVWGTRAGETEDWNFYLKSANGASTLQTIPHNAGNLEATHTLTASQLALAMQADTLRVEEEYKTGYGFGALKCWTDHLNQDNWEWLNFSGGLPATGDEVWCIAYNVPADKDIDIIKHFVELPAGYVPTADDVPDFILTPSAGTSCAAPVQVDSTIWSVTCTVPYNWNGTVTEPPKAGWEQVDCKFEVQTTQEDPWYFFCNRPIGEVQVIKWENVPPATTQTWNFTGVPGGALALSTTGTTNAADDDSVTRTKVPAGSYTIAETEGKGQCEPGSSSSDWETRAIVQVGGPMPNPNDLNSATLVGKDDVNVTVSPGQTTYVMYGNIGCGSILSTQQLVVTKYNDPAGNFTGNTGLSGWTMTITGTGGAATGFVASQPTGGSGSTVFAGIPDGTYQVCETAQANWAVIGSKYNATTQAGVCRTGVALGLAQTVNVDFYNQARVNIQVIKQVQINGINVAGPNWTFTLSGCGIVPVPQTTDGTGVTTFSNLPPAVNCTYVVTETLQAGYTAVTPSQNANPTAPGQTVVLTFVNIRNTDETPTPTPTPSETPTTTTTPTTTPPTTTTTSTQPPLIETKTPEPKTPEPTETSLTAGEKTPGPQTPIAPSAGNGFIGGGTAGTGILLAILGIAALSAGATILAIGRKPNRG
jgi:hypothetical protein